MWNHRSRTRVSPSRPSAAASTGPTPGTVSTGASPAFPPLRSGSTAIGALTAWRWARPTSSARAPWRQASSSFASHASVEHHDHVDFHLGGLWQGGNLDRGTGRIGLLEIFGHHAVDHGEVGQV